MEGAPGDGAGNAAKKSRWLAEQQGHVLFSICLAQGDVMPTKRRSWGEERSEHSETCISLCFSLMAVQTCGHT